MQFRGGKTPVFAIVFLLEYGTPVLLKGIDIQLQGLTKRSTIKQNLRDDFSAYRCEGRVWHDNAKTEQDFAESRLSLA